MKSLLDLNLLFPEVINMQLLMVTLNAIRQTVHKSGHDIQLADVILA